MASFPKGSSDLTSWAGVCFFPTVQHSLTNYKENAEEPAASLSAAPLLRVTILLYPQLFSESQTDLNAEYILLAHILTVIKP